MVAIGLTNGLGAGIHLGSAAIDFRHIKIGTTIALDASDFQYLPVCYSSFPLSIILPGRLGIPYQKMKKTNLLSKILQMFLQRKNV